jgi:hypothetical protein
MDKIIGNALTAPNDHAFKGSMKAVNTLFARDLPYVPLVDGSDVSATTLPKGTLTVTPGYQLRVRTVAPKK